MYCGGRLGCVRGPERGDEGVEGGVALRGDPGAVGGEVEMPGVSYVRGEGTVRC